MKKFFIIVLFIIGILMDFGPNLLCLEPPPGYNFWIKHRVKVLPLLYKVVYNDKGDSVYSYRVYGEKFIHFKDSSNGILFTTTGNLVQVMKTTNGGYDWKEKFFDDYKWEPSDTGNVVTWNGLPFKSATVINDSICFIGVVSVPQFKFEPPFTTHGYFWRSKDYGETWDTVRISPDYAEDVNNIACNDSGFCIATTSIGDWNANIKYVTSTDYGITWNSEPSYLPLSDSSNPNGSLNQTNNLLMEGNNIYGIRYMGAQHIIYSSDKGATWEEFAYPKEKIVDARLFPPNKLYVLSRETRFNINNGDTISWYSQMFIDYTTDYGKTWINIMDTNKNNKSLSVRGMAMLDEKNILVFGNGDVLFRTSNGGKLWINEIKDGDYPVGYITGNYTLGSFLTSDRYIIFAGGVGGSSTKTLPVLVDSLYMEGVAVREEQQPKYPFYPNPARDFINTAVYIGWQYQIYDLLGSCVQTGLIDSENINVAFLPAGFYTIRFFKEGKQVVEKMMKE
ncbi:MAG: exo-alpha-sialidase [Chloroherpetonaceae bacterium]|nr:exo-alpha-sialidase [bacterium]